MRSFLIEELSSQDMHKLNTWLQDQELQSCIEQLYHLQLPPKLWTSTQKEHSPLCGPFYLALETGDHWLKLELLVRAKSILRCSCIAYATPEQEQHMRTYLQNLLQELEISA